MENILEKLPENIRQSVLINAFHDAQDIRVKKRHTVNNPYYLKEPIFNFVKNNYQIIHNYDKPIEDIKAGDVVEFEGGLFVLVLKSNEYYYMYDILEEIMIEWSNLEDVKYPKPKTELDEAIEWLERIKKTTHGESSKHSEIILKELNKCTK